MEEIFDFCVLSIYRHHSKWVICEMAAWIPITLLEASIQILSNTNGEIQQ